MCKWENASCLIDAKKTVDSLIYISLNEKKLSNLNLQEKCENLRQKFYINACVVLDKSFHKNKKDICEHDSIIKRIYYERDKNAAHKDKDYCPREYSSLQEEIDEKKSELTHVREVCKDILPEMITLDFVPHDKELFRLINRTNKEIEQDANMIKYPLSVFHFYQLSKEGQHVFRAFDTEEQDRETAKIFGYDYDEMISKISPTKTDDIEKISEQEKKRLEVIKINGINSYEGLQNRQDSCIKMNIEHNRNVWCPFYKKHFDMIEELKAIGFYDELEMSHMEIFADEETGKQVTQIMEKYK